jgi:hypothetical protein
MAWQTFEKHDTCAKVGFEEVEYISVAKDVPELLLSVTACSEICMREIYILICESDRKMENSFFYQFVTWKIRKTHDT